MGVPFADAVSPMAIVAWPQFARVSRSLVLSIGQEDYVWASRLLGVPSLTACAIGGTGFAFSRAASSARSPSRVKASPVTVAIRPSCACAFRWSSATVRAGGSGAGTRVNTR